MAEIDIEKLPVDLHGIALANGLPSGITAHPAFKSFMREYKQALAALVLEEAAKQFDLQPHVEMFRPSVADELRTIAEGLLEDEPTEPTRCPDTGDMFQQER